LRARSSSRRPTRAPARATALLALALFANLAGDWRLSAQGAAGPAVEAEVPTAPVEFEGTELFRVRGVSSFPAPERARLIGDRLRAVAADRPIPADALRTVDGPTATQILAGDQAIMTVTDADAALERVDRPQLTAILLVRLREAIVKYREERSFTAVRRNAVNSLIATVVLAASVLALLWFWRWMDRFVMRRLAKRIHSVEIKSFEVMRAEQIATGLRNLLTLIRTTVILAFVLVYAGFVLAQWPWTRGASRNMVDFAIGPLEVIARGIVVNIPSFVFLVVLFFVIRVLLRLVRLFFDAVGRGTVTLAGFESDWAQPTYKMVRLAIVAFGLIVAYPYIPGSESDAFRGITVFIGIVFSLGSSTAIANMIAGYMMTYRRAFKVGDRVQIGDAVGEVVETRLQVTHLRSFKNEELVIPNSQILGSQVMNYSSLARTRGLILHTEVGIGYETPWRQVEAMLLEAADRTTGLGKEPKPFILEKKLGDFAVTYELNAYCHNVPAMMQLYSELHRNILDVFNEYGVQIMTPAYEGDPPEPKVVAPKDWYTSPASPPVKPAEPKRSLV
jgi:small-conductance mechanosensitive channel